MQLHKFETATAIKRNSQEGVATNSGPKKAVAHRQLSQILPPPHDLTWPSSGAPGRRNKWWLERELLEKDFVSHLPMAPAPPQTVRMESETEEAAGQNYNGINFYSYFGDYEPLEI